MIWFQVLHLILSSSTNGHGWVDGQAKHVSYGPMTLLAGFLEVFFSNIKASVL